MKVNCCNATLSK